MHACACMFIADIYWRPFWVDFSFGDKNNCKDKIWSVCGRHLFVFYTSQKCTCSGVDCKCAVVVLNSGFVGLTLYPLRSHCISNMLQELPIKLFTDHLIPCNKHMKNDTLLMKRDYQNHLYIWRYHMFYWSKLWWSCHLRHQFCVSR